MTKNKKVLFIDDGNLDEIITRTTQRLKREGYTLTAVIVNPQDQAYQIKQKDSDNFHIDFTELKSVLSGEHCSVGYDVVACDFNFANDPLNGYDVISWLINDSKSKKLRIRKAKFICYSSEEHKFSANFKNSKDLIKLIKTKIDAFYKRDSMSNDLPALLLKKEETINLSNHFKELLEENSDLVFKNTYPKFENKTLGEIATEIEKDSYHGNEFQKFLVELTIAHLIDLNRN
jgi:hypothetical protein